MMDGVTPVPDEIVPLETNVVGNYAAGYGWVHSHSLSPKPPQLFNPPPTSLALDTPFQRRLSPHNVRPYTPPPRACIPW